MVGQPLPVLSLALLQFEILALFRDFIATESRLIMIIILSICTATTTAIFGLY